MRKRSLRLLAAAAVVLGFTALGMTLAGSQAAQSGDTIQACVQKTTGAVRIVTPGTACKPSERAMTWGADGAVTSAVPAITLHGDVDVPTVPAQSCIDYPVFLPGRQAADHVLVNPTLNLPSGITVMALFDINGPDIGAATFLRVCNITTEPIDPPYGYWGFVFIRDVANGIE